MTTAAAPREVEAQASLSAELARVTGLVLVVLLPVHLVTVLLAEPADVVRLLERWRSPWWLLADWGLLTMGTAHALLHLAPRCATLAPALVRAVARGAVGGTAVLYLAASWAMLRLV